MRRLLARQYVNSIAAVLGDAAAAAADPPEDPSLNGYQSIAASQYAMTDELVVRYEASARAVAAAAMGDAAHVVDLAGCEPAATDDAACFESLVRRVGRLLWRRPVTDEEAADYVDVAVFAAEQLDDPWVGFQFALTTMLQSPGFLYEVAVGEPIAGSSGVNRLTGLEIASRMAFVLTDTTPSEALLDAAEAGELDDPAGVARWARELLGQPEARRAVQSFFAEMLELDGIEQLPKDPLLFAEWSSDLGRSMKGETLRLVTDVTLDRDAPFGEIFTSEYTFVDARLAAHYGVAPPHDAAWTRTSLPIHQERAGILSHASIMSAQAHSNSTSVTYRGKFILERFLCLPVPPPPADVVTVLPPSSTAPTMRERLEVHLTDKTCRGCHIAFDPMGLALENFDPIGRWRDKENGATIDASAEHYLLGPFDGVKQLGAALAAAPIVHECVVRNLYRYATGHVETEGEVPAIQELAAKFAEGGYRLRGLLVDLVSSETFRTIAFTPEAP
jgi:hypothetical protein